MLVDSRGPLRLKISETLFRVTVASLVIILPHIINPYLTILSDRMDCQFIMGFFSYMYYQSFIAVNQRASVGGILETAITSLSPEEQLEVVERLGRYLVGQGIVGDKVNLLPPHPAQAHVHKYLLLTNPSFSSVGIAPSMGISLGQDTPTLLLHL